MQRPSRPGRLRRKLQILYIYIKWPDNSSVYHMKTDVHRRSPSPPAGLARFHPIKPTNRSWHTASVQSNHHPCDAMFSEYDHRPASPPQFITVASRIWIFPPYDADTLDTYVLRMSASIDPATFEHGGRLSRTISLRLPPSASPFVPARIPPSY